MKRRKQPTLYAGALVLLTAGLIVGGCPIGPGTPNDETLELAADIQLTTNCCPGASDVGDLVIQNNGDTEFAWTATVRSTPTETAIPAALDPASGTLAPGALVNVTITISACVDNPNATLFIDVSADSNTSDATASASPSAALPPCDTDGDDTGADLPDADNDGVDDSIDNCLNTPNPDQTDTDGDGVGDVCDNRDDSQPLLCEGLNLADLVIVSTPEDVGFVNITAPPGSFPPGAHLTITNLDRDLSVDVVARSVGNAFFVPVPGGPGELFQITSDSPVIDCTFEAPPEQ